MRRLISLLFPFALFAAHPVFKLDSSWQLALPDKKEGKYIDYKFFSPHRALSGIRLVMAHEEMDGTLTEYLAACVKQNNALANTKASPLGPYTTKSGTKGELLHVESEGVFGTMATIQFIADKEEIAHILTVTMDKKSFLKEQKYLMAIFDSFDLCDDPLASYLSPQEKVAFMKCLDTPRNHLMTLSQGRADLYERYSTAWREESTFKETVWPAFANLIHKHYQNLGPVWELEALKYGALYLMRHSPKNFISEKK